MRASAAKAAAKLAGEKHYQGTPCKYGHSGMRRTSSGTCLECSTHWSAKGNASPRVAMWRENNASHIKKQKYFYRIEKQYGLSETDYAELLDEQDHSCKICGTHESAVPHGRLVIDHCHTNGQVRGLLCHNCNTALGHFRDSTFLMKRAMKYLEESRGVP